MQWNILNIRWQTPKSGKIFFVLVGIVPTIIFLLIFLYLLFIAKDIEIKILILIIFILISIHQLRTWIIHEYLCMTYTPYKIRWDNKGIEIINVFGRYKSVEWSWVSNIDKKVKKSLLKREYTVLYQVHLHIPENKGHNRLVRHFLYYPFKHLFFLDEETGKRLYKYWRKYIRIDSQGV